MLNLSPSRYGIGQFNHSRYERLPITHRLTRTDATQLISVGTFGTHNAVKEYESRIRPMLREIMKIPEKIYNIFVVTEELPETLADGKKLTSTTKSTHYNPRRLFDII